MAERATKLQAALEKATLQDVRFAGGGGGESCRWFGWRVGSAMPWIGFDRICFDLFLF